MSKNTLVEETPTQEQSAIAVRSGNGSSHNLMRNIGLITVREYRNRVMKRSYVITTIILLLLAFIGTCVPTIIQVIAAHTNSQTRLAIVNNAGSIAGMNSDSLTKYIGSHLNGNNGASADKAHYAVSSNSTGDLANLQKQVKDGSLNMLLVFERTANQDLHITTYTSINPTSSSSDQSVTQAQAIASQLNLLDKASRLGLTQQQSSSLFAPADFSVVNIQQNQDTRSVAERVAGIILGYAGVLLIFMTVFLYGVGVAQGVAEEKGSRIMEILVNAATPFQLMVGKIVGIGAAGLTQMAALAVVAIGGLLLQTPLKAALLGNTAESFSFNLTGVSITMVLLIFVYFILGYLLYSTLFAAVGALVSRQDEAQSAATPLTWLFMIGYMTSFFAISSPNALWVTIMSYVPFWTPTLMLMRVALGAVAWWEIPLSLVLIAVMTVICAAIAARIYRFGVLMYGQRPGLGQVIKILRMR